MQGHSVRETPDGVGARTAVVLVHRTLDLGNFMRRFALSTIPRYRRSTLFCERAMSWRSRVCVNRSSKHDVGPEHGKMQGYSVRETPDGVATRAAVVLLHRTLDLGNIIRGFALSTLQRYRHAPCSRTCHEPAISRLHNRSSKHDVGPEHGSITMSGGGYGKISVEGRFGVRTKHRQYR